MDIFACLLRTSIILGPYDINILWIERMEGQNGHRAVLNKQEVLYYAKEVFPQATITELQIDSNVPVSVQVGFYILSTEHTVQ